MSTRLIKKITGSLLAACGLVSLIAAFSTAGNARAQNLAGSCSAHTLRGLYIFATQGFNIVNGAAVPKAIVEGIDFNGDGTLTSPFATVSVNGNILRFTATPGTYTVNSDCTGTITFTNGPSFDIFVGEAGRRLWMIQTGPAVAPAVFEGLAMKVPR